ncbi:hypothetical protein [Roseovarius faecimaris]|nr:hypothetical protein [Roseovarius faecimaris]
MSTQIKQTDPKQPTLSEKALRLLAAHDREAKKFELFVSSAKPAANWS